MRALVAWIAAGAVTGFAVMWLVDAAGAEPLLGTLGLVAVIAAFGWMRRGRDTVEVVGGGFAIAYAGFLAAAAARVPHIMLPVPLATGYGPVAMSGALGNYWLVIVFAAIAAALVLACGLAWPLSALPHRHAPADGTHEAFWSFVNDYNGRHRDPNG